VLGAHLRARGDVADAPFELGQNSGLEQAAGRLTQLWNALRPLGKRTVGEHGLSLQATGSLLRTYAGAASQHVLRAQLAGKAEAARYDATLAGYWEELAGRPLDAAAREILGLPLKLSGAGLQWATTRRAAAFWAGWTACVSSVAADLGTVSLLELLDAAPRLGEALSDARTELSLQGADPAPGASLLDALQHPTKQSALVQAVQKKTHASLRQRLHSHERATLLGAGGPGAAGFLGYPSDPACSLEDALWATGLRARAHLPRPECAQAELQTAAQTCQNRPAAEGARGAPCGQPLDEQGTHGATCALGGGVERRHGSLENAVAGLVRRWLHQEPLTEQRVPAWDRIRCRRPADPPDADLLERAVLDVEYNDGASRHWIDVSVRHPAAEDVAQAAARRPGEAARRGERQKHARYPGDRLTPFVVETPGRLGGEARQWLLRQVRTLPGDRQPGELTRAYKVVSCAVQAQLALQRRRAAGLA
jgi:hypothetical protein